MKYIHSTTRGENNGKVLDDKKKHCPIECPNCGSPTQVTLKEVFKADTYVQVTWECGCGTEQVTRMSYEDYVHYNFNMTPLAYQMIQAINKKRGE